MSRTQKKKIVFVETTQLIIARQRITELDTHGCSVSSGAGPSAGLVPDVSPEPSSDIAFGLEDWEFGGGMSPTVCIVE